MIAATLADCPEKYFILKSALIGTYGKVDSWAMDVRAILLAGCSVCFSKRVRVLSKDRYSKFDVDTYHRCCQWDLRSTSMSSQLVHPLADCPTKACPNSSQAPSGRLPGATYVVLVQQSFGWMRTIVEFTAHNVRANIWNHGMMEAYLQTCAISTAVRDHVWKQRRPTTEK